MTTIPAPQSRSWLSGNLAPPSAVTTNISLSLNQLDLPGETIISSCAWISMIAVKVHTLGAPMGTALERGPNGPPDL
eukprot:9026044-Heterocapsa_arctica.AAC.1